MTQDREPLPRDLELARASGYLLPRIAEGGACVGIGADCGPELRCVEGTCTRLSPADVNDCN